MEGILTIGTLIIVALLGVWGLQRGVFRGFLTLGGTLLAAVVIDLWATPMSTWVRTQFPAEDPTEGIWIALAIVFLAVGLFVGYGSSLLIPEHTAPPSGRFGEQMAGALVGALNGVLIVSYLLRYTAEIRPTVFASIEQSSLVLGIVYRWLPWFILVVTLVIAAWVLVYTVMWLIALSRHAAAKSTDSPRRAASNVRRGSVAPAPMDRMQGISSKIDQVLKENPRK